MNDFKEIGGLALILIFLVAVVLPLGLQVNSFLEKAQSPDTSPSDLTDDLGEIAKPWWLPLAKYPLLFVAVFFLFWYFDLEKLFG